MPERTWSEADDREVMRLGDALAGSHWPEFVDLADRGQITAREASQRYSRLGGRNRFDVDAVVDAAEKLPDAHEPIGRRNACAKYGGSPECGALHNV